ncbi:family 43 glycosylhydrolase [Dorea acetigenes]|uniref:Family 43 glycosylhydrolase n=1 Tax=Dorea acetigenes TaxID=2981787 RepID=A0ABT2RQ66_9FIRM|nr:family 43 glycosylhydrolase [Dorea acetigenes]MCU6687566.1 family 43 glycosylhydrolase [Dorea acetigenes]SCJ47631.1 Arabinoxylan arabinofuranohydrolase precursor [uncultured Clostridium sp.]
MKKKTLSKVMAVLLTAAMLVPQVGVTAAENTEETEEVVLLDFTFDDKETGFKGGQAVAEPKGEIVEIDGRKALYLDGANTNWLDVTKEDGSSLLTGVEEMTISYDMKTAGGSPNWAFFAAPDTTPPTFQKEQYIGALAGSTLKIERYKNEGVRAEISEVPLDASDWVHIEVTLGKNSTTVKVGDAEPVTQDGLVSVLDILGRNPIFYIGKATWIPWGTNIQGEYYTGYLDNFKITGKVIELPLDKEALQSALKAAKAVGAKDLYTEKSWQRYETALTEAERLNDAEKAEQADIDAAAAALNDAIDRLILVNKEPAAKLLDTANPLIDYKFGADPYAMEYDGRVYIYMTNDSQEYEAQNNGSADNSYASINTINVISSADMVNWTDHGSIPVAGRNNPDGAAKWATNSWAPAATHKTIDGKEKFFLYFADNGAGIGVLESDSPIGPFVDPIGKALVAPGSAHAQGVIWLFDPAVLLDDDGTGYLYYGGGVGNDANNPKTSRVVKLTDDMVHLDGDAQVIDAPAIFEDSGIHKYGNKYYYSYCSNFSKHADGYPGQGNICYMESDSPMGPFNYIGEILANPATFFGVGGNNHHAIFEFGGEYYITYHAQTLGKAIGNTRGYRSTHINKIHINEDGKIDTITADMKGVEQLKTVDPYQRLESENFAWNSGIKTVVCAQDGGMVKELNMAITDIQDREWTALSGVDFGEEGAAKLTANVAGKAGGTIEVRLDAKDGDLVGTLEVPAGDGSYKTVECTLEGATGEHKVFFVFRGEEEKDLMDVDYWAFEEKAAKPDATVESITITTPTKTEYTEGEELDLDGMKVTAKYSDDTTKDIAVTDCEVTGYNKNEVGEQTVTVTYEGKTATFKVTVKEAEKPDETNLPYVDVVKDDWFYNGAYYNYFAGTMTGTDPTHFSPYATLVRAQFATILYRLNGEPKVEYETRFPDVSDGQFYSKAVIWAAEAEVVTGYTDSGYFGTNDPITREQMVTMMYRYADHMGYESEEPADISKYTDADKVTEFAEAAMKWAVGNGIIEGKENTDGSYRLDPQDSTSRAECAIIIQRFMENLTK